MTDSGTCDVCGEKMYADQEWTLKPGIPPVGDAKPGDYIHKKCEQDYDREKHR